MSRDANELVFALCHEVGNLLAATRLQAFLLDGAGPGDVRGTAEAIAAATARAGALLAQVRPLLARPADGAAAPLDPIDVLDGLQRGLDEATLRRIDLDLKSALDLPAVRADAEMLRGVLCVAVFGALEEAEAPVRVSAERRAGAIAFCVDAALRDEGPDGPALCGRRLERACADAILRARGGRVEAEQREGRSLVAYCVPLS